MKLEEAGVACYDFGPSGRTPRQTPRPVINLRDAILPSISFDHPEFNRVLDWLKAQSITETKGVFTDLSATVNGFTFVFGLGGIHGSLESVVVGSDDEHVIVDLDVTSYYPNLAITNGFYPSSSAFTDTCSSSARATPRSRPRAPCSSSHSTGSTATATTSSACSTTRCSP
jgi:hypothetical protein